MLSAARSFQTGQWLTDGGLKRLERMLWALVYPSPEAILITSDDRTCTGASCGAGKLLGLPREQILGRRIDDFVDPRLRPQIGPIWQDFLQSGEQRGVFRLAGTGSTKHEVEYAAKGSILPGSHILALRPQSAHDKHGKPSAIRHELGMASIRHDLAHDYAVYVFDAQGAIVSWFGGAQRIYGYPASEMVSQPVSLLYPDTGTLSAELHEEWMGTAAQGHLSTERWHMKKDGSRFWANVVTTALRSEAGELRGFAAVVRDCNERHSAEAKLLSAGALPALRSSGESHPGVVLGEFDRIADANEAFLQLAGYSREDLAAGVLRWPDLTPMECSHLDELAHQKALRHMACPPYEKELIRKNGSRVKVLVTFALLDLSMFRWMTIVHALPEGQAGGKATHEHKSGNFEEIVGRSPSMQRLLKLVETVAPTNATVLILGETGTGKELVARAIHRLSHRKSSPFITLNCAAIPTGLLESELFGYERGAFTGALTQKIGRFEMAHRGTLFLDEVGDIPLELQPKLLRALQEKSFERLGGTRTIPIDVRLIAATNRNLTQMMGDKLFRSDLYYRLKIFPVTTPPLREHPEDIPVLAHYFARKYALEMGRHVELISPETMHALMSWTWPGNVRELENFIERSVILSTGSTLNAPLAELQADDVQTSGTLAEKEREYIMQVLEAANGVISTAAIRLGLPRTTLNAKMQRLGISRKDL